MVIIMDYQLKYICDHTYVCKSKEHMAVCPICGGSLKYRDSRKRIFRNHGGKKSFIFIRRLKCTACGRLHNELPDVVTPYKHYGTEIIEDVLDGVTTEEDPAVEDGPASITMERWRRWFEKDKSRMEAYFRLLTFFFSLFEKKMAGQVHMSLESFRRKGPGWLGAAQSCLYNCGGYLFSSKYAPVLF